MAMTDDTSAGKLARGFGALWTGLLMLLRFLFGLMFTISGIGWILRADSVGYLRDALETALATPGGVVAYEAFLRGVVLEFPASFTTLVAAGELLSGLALLAGSPPRAGAAGAVFLAANYGVAFQNRLLPPGGNFVLMILLLPLLAGRAYRHLVLRWPSQRRDAHDGDPA